MKIVKRGDGYSTVISYKQNGKWKQKRITAERKRDVEIKAAQFISVNDQLTEDEEANLLWPAAVARFLAERESVLSPSTYSAYSGIARNHFSDWELTALSEITVSLIQQKISAIAVKRSPKTVANINGFIHAVLSEFRPSFRFSVKLPQKKKPELYVPTDEEYKKILAVAKDTEMEVPILLAGMGGLREGEVCALTIADIGDGWINISKSLVRKGMEYKVKQPKTSAGVRRAFVPKELTDRIRQTGYVTKLLPHIISKRYQTIVAHAGVPRHRFHDLRAYFASSLHYLGIPDQTIMQLGGWHDQGTMQGHYRRTMQDKLTEEVNMIADKFGKMI